ncbi:MAG: LTA synthase family protein [Lachnospiraceae bacterium]|nr:LTA synthase family protein [Lachnospiraceae bacterium]
MKVKRYLGFYILLPILLEILIESFNRKSVFSAFKYLTGSPLLFLFNTLIIMLTLSIAMFFKREIFALVTIATVWVLFGVVNFVILHFRVTPFSAVDFTLIKSAISVSGHYLNLFTIAMVIFAAVVLLVGLVCLFLKAPVNTEYNHRQILFSLTFCATLGMAIVVIHRSSNSVQALSTHYTNISEAYENYGFAYCFANSILDTGIKKPENYSEESVRAVSGALDNQKSSDKHPNIIMVQLESFFDVEYVKGLRFSRDPLPNFHRLERKYSSGMITVPTVGAGTVNTEFEVLTGMRQHDFGVSEYPYKTVLKTTASESVCTDLKALGYTAHAVHNNEATFYGRNIVFSSLGFDTFSSMEFMNGLTDNLNGWCNDDVLTKEVVKTLDSTEGPDFTMVITVQSHGKYDGISMDDPDITVSGAPEGKEDAYQYYVNQLYEVDQVIGALIQELNRRQEKTVLVLYGDHLPSMELGEDDLSNGDLYQTQYVIWDNMELEKQDKDLHSFELYADVLQRIDIHEGMITKYHQQTNHGKKAYYEGLTMLSYDLLYGENYVYGGENPFVATELQMGTEKVQLTKVQKTKGKYRVIGKGFTPFCKVYYDGKQIESVWRDSGCLEIQDDFELEEKEKAEEKVKAAEDDPDDLRDVPDAFVVEVQTEDGVVLDSTEIFPASKLRK